MAPILLALVFSDVFALQMSVDFGHPGPMVVAELAFIGSTSRLRTPRRSLPPLEAAQPCG